MPLTIVSDHLLIIFDSHCPYLTLKMYLFNTVVHWFDKTLSHSHLSMRLFIKDGDISDN